MVLSETDRDRTVTINKGSVLTVRLKENPTTGYRWFVSMIEGIEIISDHNDAGGPIGASSVRVFKFRLNKTGSYNLKMKHWREWEGEASVIDRFNIKIIVQ
jgi:inhibitor of cysteine peptidase